MRIARLSVFFVATSMSALTFAQTAPSQGKTRAEVVQALVQAQHEGTVPANKHNYPPSADLVARNKELHTLSVHAGESGHELDAHDSRLASR
ncbi:DUF4148 domain-containing protein [Paraburkholderia fungorum]|jgi:hypothetical protein|uniref:DUF4148 domain-containing protein n=2 Tax=Paraburkholderia fungorum TaxID=134537 RepID=A0AAU8SXF4_9BURK|nr:DUF4148 domain-containing protein [Paraburkholderia fungorum]AJZ56094.1 hypothetical protein OI25_8193 [Paraburkholderia fungorum]MBU7440640.1 DUF4148 domain-containing protein [Paraburkholderia fungorum]MDE1006481.1 DUF4148 domain-containing protein [Paraburkholderia fungorum]PNE59449.1 DUF4148 domain-containing protein [Paraburkholderia fungorum]PRZ52496.1 uncharacterized protein DUF4148 [Paraburkholderia fungorum]